MRLYPLFSLSLVVQSLFGCTTVDSLQLAEDFTHERITESELGIAGLVDLRPDGKPDLEFVHPESKDNVPTSPWSEKEKRDLQEYLQKTLKGERDFRKVWLIESKLTKEFREFSFEGSVPAGVLSDIRSKFKGRYLIFLIIDSETYSTYDRSEDKEDSNEKRIEFKISKVLIESRMYVLDVVQNRFVLEAKDKTFLTNEYEWEESKTLTGGMWDQMVYGYDDYPDFDKRLQVISASVPAYANAFPEPEDVGWF